MTRAPAALLAALALVLGGCPSDEDCPAGQELCIETCRDPASFATDPANCGACGVDCGLGVCAGGACACDPGATFCDGLHGRCRELESDPTSCGACGDVCARPGEGCDDGVCRCTAPRPDDCGTFCTDVLTDAANCGACGPEHACTVLGQVCSAGGCACPASRPTVCGATCCAGSGCCGAGDTCPTGHPNGLGGAYFDCGALDEHTAPQARLAAQSWSPAGQTVEAGLQCSGCLCRQSASEAAVWCYAGSNARGRVQVTSSPNCFAAACPSAGSPEWR